MEWIPLIVVGVLALAAVLVAAWLAMGRGRALAEAASAQTERDAAGMELASLRNDIEAKREEVAQLHSETAQLRERLNASEQRRDMELASQERVYHEKLEALERQRAELSERQDEQFQAASAKALKEANEAFLKLAEQRLKTGVAEADRAMDEKRAAFNKLIEPIQQTLSKTGERLEKYEDRRAESFAKLAQQINDIGAANSQLRDETGKLVKALSKPEVRGRYGEIQLRRVAELAGMTAYCDFSEQSSTRDSDGQLLRPDMVVRLPNDRRLAVDAKTNTYAYVEAVSAETPEAREKHLERFARHVADQAKKLSQKSYWSELDHSPEFVVMFVPGDHFLDAALERRPDLIELAAQLNIVLATPSTLIGLLRAVHVGWREKSLADDADELFKLGRELHERAAVAFGHANKLGDTLRKAVEHYNKFTGSVDSRLMPTLKKFEETGAKGKKSLEQPSEVVVAPRLLESAEAVSGSGAAPDRP
ncbi:MAG: DNA recombination protein RmuC [Planctomycetota bacterium]